MHRLLPTLGLLPLLVAAPLAAQSTRSDAPTRKEMDAVLEALRNMQFRSEDIDTQLLDIQRTIGTRPMVRALHAMGLELGGAVTQQFTVSMGQHDNESAFNATELLLQVEANVAKDWTLHGTLGARREADIDLTNPQNPKFRKSVSRVSQLIAWANYEACEGIQVQFGRFLTPHGIINQQHFAPLLLDVTQPQFLRPFPGDTIFPNFLNGAQVHGKATADKDGFHQFRYHAFLGNHAGGASEDMVYGGRFAYTLGDTGLTFGVNVGTGKRIAAASSLGNLTIVGSTSLTTNYYHYTGFDVLYDKDDILWKTEYFFTEEANQPERMGIYTQPAWRIDDQWIVFYRYDYLDPGQGLQDVQEHMAGINYLPNKNVRIRAVFIHRDYDLGKNSDDPNFVQVSATVSF